MTNMGNPAEKLASREQKKKNHKWKIVMPKTNSFSHLEPEQVAPPRPLARYIEPSSPNQF